MPKRKSSKPKQSKAGGGKALSELSVEEFMESSLLSGSSEGEGEEEAQASKKVKMSTSMSRLATSDPEFYQYLCDNDEQLLGFEESGSESEGDEESVGSEGELEPVPQHISSWKQQQISSEEERGDDGDDGDDGEVGEEEGMQGVPVTVAMVKSWVDSITKAHSLAALKQLYLALRAAVWSVQGEGEGEAEGGRGVYSMNGTSEFNAVVLACLSHVSPCLLHHIPPPHPHSAGRKPFLPSSHKNWNRVRPVVQPYCLVLLRLMSGLREPSMLCAVLRHIRSLAPYYAAVSKLQRSLSRTLLRQWAREEHHVQVMAFLILRQITLLTPHPSLHTTLKKLYLTFVRNAKFTSLSSLPRIAFMKNCVVEMISLDVATGYQHGFVYIRQLALHLRAAITSGKKDSLQVVRSWQFVHCLDLWCQALSALLPSSCSLLPLLHPLVETALGTLSLQPSPRTVPLRLHLTASLSRLAAATGTYIPLAPHLLEVLEAHSGHLVPGPQSAKPPELSCLLRPSTSQLQSRGYQTAILNRGFELLLQLLASQTHLIAFPELAYPTVVRMRKVIKTTPISWFRQQLKQLVEKVEEVSVEVSRERSHVTFAPKDADKIAAWEMLRKEKGRDALNRFLATWEKLNSVAEATPIPQKTTPTRQPKDKKEKHKVKVEEKPPAKRGRKRGMEEEQEEGEGDRDRDREVEIETEGGRGSHAEEEDGEEDIVKDFEFSSDSELSD